MCGKWKGRINKTLLTWKLNGYPHVLQAAEVGAEQISYGLRMAK